MAKHKTLTAGQIGSGGALIGDLGQILGVFFGVVLCLSAFGLWLVPEATETPLAVAIRAGLTCLFTGVGFALFRAGRDRSTLGCEIDLLQGMLHQTETGQDGVALIRRSIALSKVARLRFEAGQICAYGPQGELLMQVPVDAEIPQADLDMMLPPHRTAPLSHPQPLTPQEFAPLNGAGRPGRRAQAAGAQIPATLAYA